MWSLRGCHDRIRIGWIDRVSECGVRSRDGKLLTCDSSSAQWIFVQHPLD